MAQIVRIKLSGPINGAWFVTPMYLDGTVGEARKFDTPQAAQAFADSEYSGTPISMAHHTQSRHKVKRVRIPLFADQVPRPVASPDEQPKPEE